MRQKLAFVAIALAAMAAIVLPASPAFAQYSPDATLDLGTGYGATALSQSILGGTSQIGTEGGQGTDELSPTMKEYCATWPEETTCVAYTERAAQRAQQQQAQSQMQPGMQPQPQPQMQPAAAPDQARMNEMRAVLEPQYERRVREEGKASADRWLVETARRLGEQDGRAAREGQ